MQPDDWSHGYITDQLYTDGFYRELSPAWMNYVAALNGCHPRPIDGAFTYLELGCGLGQSTNVLAACFPKAQFYGVDFNPAHVDHARIFARDAGIANATFLEKGFDELADGDVPPCDFIGLHGILSWVSPEVQRAIRGALKRFLKPGGLAYLSYNAMPGWASSAPNQKLFYEFSQELSGPVTDRMTRSLAQAKSLVELKSAYHLQNDAAVRHLDTLADKAPAYLVHEYLNGAWHCFYSSDIADAMAEAKLTYCGAATLIENHTDLVVGDAAAKMLREQPTDRLRQLLLDFLMAQRFRRDVFVRGHARLNGTAILQTMRGLHLAPARALTDADVTAKLPRGEISFDKGTYPVVRRILMEGSLPVGDLVARIRTEANLAGEIDRTLHVMAACGHLMPAAQSFLPAAMPAHPSRYNIPSPVNRALLAKAVETKTRRYLASEVLGNGVAIEPAEAIALDVFAKVGHGKALPREKLEDAIREQFAARNLRPKAVQGSAETPEEGMRRIAKEHATHLIDDILPQLVRTGIATCH
jgi:SAM-dependent methyltransferase